MGDKEPKQSSAESNVVSALEELDFNAVNKANCNQPDSGADNAGDFNEDLEIVGVSDDDEENPDRKKQNGDNSDVKPNSHPAKQLVDRTVETEDDLEPAPPSQTTTGEAGDEDENIAVGIGSAPKKKKKKSKPKSKRGLAAPTGFEEYYVDAPVTPAEFEEEKSLYDDSRAFTERIEIAIQRYVAKRNLDAARKDLFDKYLAYGGIEAGPKMFGGLATKDMSNLDAAQIAAQRARHFVGADKNDDEEFVVDFEACAAAFLSSRLPIVYDLTSLRQIKSHTTIIFNFLNYLLHHDVAPEYRSQICAARTICTLAEKELWQIVQAESMLPGDFNTACSMIFGGTFHGLSITGKEDWVQGVEVKKGMSPEMARKCFKVGLAANAGRDIFDRYKAQSEAKTISITSITDVALEVISLIPATPQVQNIYTHSLAKDLKPLGLLKARTWTNPSAKDEDLTLEEEEALAAATPHREVKEYTFWVEDYLLKKLFVGMKFETTVTKLSFGVLYFDALFGVYCSFYRVLPNEMMFGWREPGPKLPMREKNMVGGGVKGIEQGSWEEWDGGEDGGEEEDKDEFEQGSKVAADDEDGTELIDRGKRKDEHMEDIDDAELTGEAIDGAEKYAEEGE